MKFIKVLIGVSLGLAIAGCQVKPTTDTLTKLQGDEVQDLFSGKTVESFNVISGSTSFTYYDGSGRLLQERYWVKRNGRWMINAQGQICLSIEEKAPKCRHVFRKGNKYYKYRLDSQGELEKVIRYRQFIDGKKGFSKES